MHTLPLDLLITDPLSQPGVITDVPPGVSPTDLLPIGYQSANAVRCSFCPQRQPHNRGYFAVLPGGQLALCGNCCAKVIGGKETVAAIDRKRKEQTSSNMRRAVSDRVTRGIPELLALLEPVRLAEALARQELHSLYRFVDDRYYHHPHLPFAMGVGGLKAIMKKANEGSISERNAPELVQRRSKALQMIKDGFDDIPPLIKRVTKAGLPEELHTISREYGLHLHQDGSRIRFRKDPWSDIREHHVQFVTLPDFADLRAGLLTL